MKLGSTFLPSLHHRHLAPSSHLRLRRLGPPIRSARPRFDAS